MRPLSRRSPPLPFSLSEYRGEGSYLSVTVKGLRTIFFKVFKIDEILHTCWKFTGDSNAVVCFSISRTVHAQFVREGNEVENSMQQKCGSQNLMPRLNRLS